ncbi:MAG: ribonuclease Z [Proteiniphilum sp.]|nr:ribonuclease Z [Proteiniphilum sp.]MDD4159140.1 ribonuclease Z [Proteiniphilum sp.]MDD4800881.1 ribonuclease Z [Proteiniphilum sp.]
MTRFDITILGCGSAMPSTLHHPPSQLIDLNDKLFMIDCGEGTQLQMRKFKTRMGKLHALFISHLHGDHIFGLPGLISTLSLLGRTDDLHIYSHRELDFMLKPLLIYMGSHLSFRIHLHPMNPSQREVIYENKTIRIISFPLKHRIDTNGFLFEEKERPRHMIREMIDFYRIPLRQIAAIKAGADFVTEEGTAVPNNILTTPAAPPRKYAYCSDTAYAPEIIPYIEGADLLYHEATFAESELSRATETYHSTARQAAEMAAAARVKKLVIGHFSSRYNELETLLQEASEIFPQTELADEGKILSL